MWKGEWANLTFNFSNEKLFYPAVYAKGRNVMDISPHNLPVFQLIVRSFKNLN